MWIFYVLCCNDNSLYCGITTDIFRRINQHNGNLRGGAKYTRSKRPVKLIFFSIYKNRSEASREEFYFKSLRRNDKIKYMNSNQNYLPGKGCIPPVEPPEADPASRPP